MLSKLLTGVAGAIGAAAVLTATIAVASADPPVPGPVIPPPFIPGTPPTPTKSEPPPLPNVNAFPPTSPVDFTVLDGNWLAFAAPGGVTCMIDKGRNAYGCSGPLPAAPEGANLVAGVGAEEPGFGNSAGNAFAAAGAVKPLPPQQRLSFRNVACAIDGAGATTCQNTSSQHGFVLSPAGSFTA